MKGKWQLEKLRFDKQFGHGRNETKKSSSLITGKTSFISRESRIRFIFLLSYANKDLISNRPHACKFDHLIPTSLFLNFAKPGIRTRSRFRKSFLPSTRLAFIWKGSDMASPRRLMASLYWRLAQSKSFSSILLLQQVVPSTGHLFWLDPGKETNRTSWEIKPILSRGRGSGQFRCKTEWGNKEMGEWSRLVSN